MVDIAKKIENNLNRKREYFSLWSIFFIEQNLIPTKPAEENFIAFLSLKAKRAKYLA